MLILTFTVLASKLYFIFSYFEHYSFFNNVEHYSPKMFFSVSVYFDLSRHHLCILFIFPVWVFLTISGKRLTSVSLVFFSSSSLVRLSDIGCRSGLWFPSYAVFSHDVVSSFGQYLSSSFLDLANIRNYIFLGWVKV